MVKVKSGYSCISSSALVKVSWTTSTVSVQGHSQAMSMWVLPVAWMVKPFSQASSGFSFSWAARRDWSKPAWSPRSSALQSTAARAEST